VTVHPADAHRATDLSEWAVDILVACSGLDLCLFIEQIKFRYIDRVVI